MSRKATNRPFADRVNHRGIEREARIEADPVQICAALGRSDALLLHGQSTPGAAAQAEQGWGPLVALAPRVLLARSQSQRADAAKALTALDRVLATRRFEGGPRGCGIAVLISYEFFDRRAEPMTPGHTPAIVAWAVDSAVRYDGAIPVAVARAGAEASLEGLEGRLADAIRRSSNLVAPKAPVPCAALRTSLPKAGYLDAVRRAKEHIRRGDIYQANLTQRFDVSCAEEPIGVFRRLIASTPAPRSAFVAGAGFAVASASPETFLSVTPGGRISTWPIKGTRRRGQTPEEDRQAARELVESEKDRAELTMIVDLERNDLGRVCRAGSIRVATPPQLRSYSAVHHLVAEVEGELTPETRPSEIIRATFPGGSITGAPKIRAMEILRTLEPVPRGFYTGSLFWFGDDGAIDSSILIRSVVLVSGRACVGAGGGVVADSDPEGEWRESNDKARAILALLSVSPEEAV